MIAPINQDQIKQPVQKPLATKLSADIQKSISVFRSIHKRNPTKKEFENIIIITTQMFMKDIKKEK